MSQAGTLLSGGSGSTTVQTLTGNSGGALGPTGGNINVVGSGTISVAGNPGTSTLTISSSAIPGSFVLIQTQTAAGSSSIDFTTGITSTYSSYFFLVSNVTPGTNNTVLELKVSTNGGATYIGGTDYWSGASYATINSAAWTTNPVGGGGGWNISLFLTTANAIGYGCNFYMDNVTNGAVPSFRGNATYFPNGGGNGDYTFATIFGFQASAVNLNAFRFIMSAGTLATGSFSLYGIVR